MSKNLIIRTMVAIIFGPLIILISYLGGHWLAGMILLFSAIGIIEFLTNSEILPKKFLFWLVVMGTIAIVSTAIYSTMSTVLFIFVIYFLLLGLFFSIRRMSPQHLFSQYSSIIWATAYLGLLYPFVYFIRNINPDKGGDWLLFLFSTLWLSDSLAMWAGSAIGSRKFAPTISPGKTLEGFIGGMFGGVIIAMLMGYWRLSEFMIPLLIGGGLLVSIIGQLGDLVESIWKRSIGIKDSSMIIPGHGGVLDRFDSLLFSAPALYFYLKFIVYG
jgi:phosphatidate cytidylyltransferase